MIVSLEGVSKSFGEHLVLREVSAKIEDGVKIGLVGANGAGKSTLLSIIYGDLEPDTGTASRNRDAVMGFLRQNSGLSEDGTIDSETRGVFSHLRRIEDEMRQIEEKIALIGHSSPDYPTLAAQYDALQANFEAREGYMTDVKISTVLNGMGFGGVNRDTPVSVLSGGEKTRLALCKLLLEAPGLLIMDEPTNHLDFKTLLWLEEYLRTYRGALLVVSHDRYFLDRLCGQIWEIADHSLSAYNGNYTSFVLQKEERFQRQQKEYEEQQREIANMKDFIARNIVRASTTNRAKSRQKALERMDVVEKPKAPPKPARISFKYKNEPVKDVLHVKNLSVSVDNGEAVRTLFKGIDFDMTRGEKIALIGANGIGKSTFLKAIQDLFPHDAGNVEWGRGVDVSYFEQEEFMLDSSKTALDEIWDRFPREYEHTIRTVLGHVRITGENIYKKVGDLSGGERARLKFAILALSCGNVLIMDEPTNHLDLATKEALDRALQEYTGTLLVVSHDRYLLNKFPDGIAEMREDGIVIYKGNYDAYLEQQQKSTEPSAPAESAPSQAKNTEAASGYRGKKQRSEEAARKNRIQELEKKIETLETEIWGLENEITTPEIAAEYLVLSEKCAILEEKRLELSVVLGEWAALCEDL